MNDIRKLDPIPDAQAYLGGISRTTLYELAKRGDVLLVNIGRRAFITRDSMDSYVASLTPGRVA
ncbi:helix-turn-helix domain-containing protein [Microbacterium sp. E-13]|uniref:helix-turn-helix domain-containing protein n=1 Tax=Microbacterium sp. E-13 TaxID=3404048 RepID=UPI003CEC67E9